LIPSQFSQGPKLIALNWVNAINPAFQSLDVKVPFVEVDLIPMEVNRLSNPQSMSSHYQDQRSIPLPIPTRFG